MCKVKEGPVYGAPAEWGVWNEVDYKCSLLQKEGIHKGCFRKDGLMQKGGAGEGAEGTIFS